MNCWCTVSLTNRALLFSNQRSKKLPKLCYHFKVANRKLFCNLETSYLVLKLQNEICVEYSKWCCTIAHGSCKSKMVLQPKREVEQLCFETSFESWEVMQQTTKKQKKKQKKKNKTKKKKKTRLLNRLWILCLQGTYHDS